MDDYDSEELRDWSHSIYHELYGIARDLEYPDRWLLSDEMVGTPQYANNERTQIPAMDASDSERAVASVEGFVATIDNWAGMLSELPRHQYIIEAQALMDAVGSTLRHRLPLLQESPVSDAEQYLAGIGRESGLQIRLVASRVYSQWAAPERTSGQRQQKDANTPTPEDLNTIRRVIRLCERKERSAPKEIQAMMRDRKIRTMRMSRFYSALRELEKSGDYKGFSRPRRPKD